MLCMVTVDDWMAARPTVDGLDIERQRDGPLLRLRSGETVLAEGDMAVVQRALVDVLTERHGDGRVSIPLPTMGGTQFWADVRWDGGWRVQRHALTGHFRLLDGEDVRRAWGTRLACRAALEQHRLEGDVATSPEHLVILLHGLGRSRRALKTLAERIAAQGLPTARLSYPSTRGTLAEHASDLNDVLAGLEGVARVSYVTHSMGGIVVRHALGLTDDGVKRPPPVRVVMLAPPSKGSAVARVLEDVPGFGLVMGPAAQELAHISLETLPAPPCPFGIVAAIRGKPDGANPLIPGDDDGVVGVDETMLPGADDTLIVRGLHTFMMDDPDVADATVRFLRTGWFLPEGEDGRAVEK